MYRAHSHTPRRRRTLPAVLAAVAIASGSLLAVGVATPASAHDNTASATCEALTVNASYYETKPGQGEPTVTVTNPDYVAPVPSVPAVGSPTIAVEKPNPDHKPEQAATYENVTTDVEYKKHHWLWGWDVKWFPVAASPAANSGWIATGNVKTMQVEKTPYVPAQGSPTITVQEPNPAYVPEVPAKDAVGSPTTVEDNPDYVAPVDEPNTITVWIDGDVVEDKFFGTSYSNVFTFDNKHEQHEWKIQITAWNDASGSRGWTKTRTGTSTPCDIPVVAANPTAAITAVCGEATITLTNPENEGEDNKTASFIAQVDGEFHDAYAVAGNESKTVVIPFKDDSGDHSVEIYQAGTSEWKLLAEAAVASDCAAVTPPVDEPTPTEQPTAVTPTTTATPLAAVARTTTAPALAETGGSVNAVLPIAAIIAALVGIALLSPRARRS